MKLVDVGSKKAEESRLKDVNRSLGKLIPTQARDELNARDTVAGLFGKILDNRFQLLHGIRLQALEGLNTMILIGPPGVWLIEAYPAGGIFRAGSDTWEEMDPKLGAFRPVRPNLPARLIHAAKSLQPILSAHAPDMPPIEAVALFTHPGAHLELQNPPLRMLQADAIGRFAVGLLQSRVVLDRETIQRLVDMLSTPPANLAATQPVEEEQPPAPASGEAAKTPRLPNIPEQEPEIVRRVSRFASFSLFQWLVLGLLVLLVIGVLIAGILVMVLLT